MAPTTTGERVAAAAAAVRAGDVAGLQELVTTYPELATARIGPDAPGEASRTLLHVVADWPGHFPNGAASVRVLVAAGADVDARTRPAGSNRETPLHWAASSDDVEVLDALLDAGADIEAPGAVIGGGTPLADATAFAQWRAARRLIERGARSTLWESAALGLLDRVADWCATTPPPPAEEITRAFWGACHGGHRDTAAWLLARGADRHWVGWDRLTPLGAAERSGAGEVVAWLRSEAAQSASSPR